jgi:MinD superfamily P-loop ATPase
MKKITVLSGKGGVGKSSITASLALALSGKHKVICADCDVDAPNLALVLGLRESDFEEWRPLTTNKKARIIPEKCTGCMKCRETCYFGALEWDEKNNRPVFKEFGCEGCGACMAICPEKAIELFSVDNAKIGYGKTKYGFLVVSGQLEIGESGSGKVVTAVRNMAESKSGDADVMLVDAAAGIGCPVIASVTGSDYVIAVTEPTPSGFSDLKRALEMVSHFNIPHGIVINKHDLNPSLTKEIERFAGDSGICILARIPYDKTFMEALINLVPATEYNHRLRPLFDDITEKLKMEISI